jgi:Uma2 family endonuclease
MTTATQTSTLEEFLSLPETKPASEFINGKISQKSMPQGEHSRLQSKLVTTINEVTESSRIAYAFPELRCVFGGRAIVPDISVFRWDRIPKTASGKIANRFETYPDWAIEILSPEQSQTEVLGKLLICSSAGSELGWLINPFDEAILVIIPVRQVDIFQGDRTLPVLDKVNLTLTANEIFAWLNFG